MYDTPQTPTTNPLGYDYQIPESDPFRTHPDPNASSPVPDLSSIAGSYSNSLVTPDTLTDREKAQVELAGKIAQANERKNRVGDLVKAAQYPYIKADMDASAAKQDALMKQIDDAKALLQTPAPTLVQNQLSMPQLLAAGLGSLIAHNHINDVLGAGVDLSNAQNKLDYANKTNQFNLNRESAQDLIKFLQNQYLNEQQTGGNAQQLLERAQIDDQQALQRQQFQTAENDKQRDLTERDKAWSDFYHSDNEGEVRAAAARLAGLDKENAPSQPMVEQAVAAARSKREKQALDYWRQTVGWKISQYGGKVPDADAPGLTAETNSIAAQFGVDPKLFGDLPTASFWKKQYETDKLSNRKTEIDQKYKFLDQKQRDDLAVKWSNVDIAKDRAQIAQQNANINGARLEWQKVKGDSTTIEKKLTSTKATVEKNLAGAQAAIRRVLGSKTRDQVTHDYFKQKDLKPLYNKEATYQGQLDYINQHLAEVKDNKAQADLFNNTPSGNSDSQSGSTNPNFTKKKGGLNPGESRSYTGGISITRNK